VKDNALLEKKKKETAKKRLAKLIRKGDEIATGRGTS